MVVSAPSGGGKTTLCKRLVSTMEGADLSISHTTRPPRPTEEDHVDYHFIDEETFARLVDADAFLEWAEVHGHRYGTARSEAEGRLAGGVDVLFDIDVQGGRQIADRLGDAVLVFILPPDRGTLELRLRGRGSDADDVIARRLDAARHEIAAACFYTHWVINDDFETALGELKSILVSERIRRVDSNQLVSAFLQGS